jgi:hypothetical protein
MKSLARVSALFLFASCLQAGDTPAVDPDLPQPLDSRFADDLLTHSPFTRSVNLEESLQLTGIAYVNGHPVATVLNKQTKERVIVSEELNAQGWQLLAASAGADPSNSQIEMRVGPETITMHYHGQELSSGGNGDSKARLAGSSSKKDGEKLRPSTFLGEQGREMYASLSSEARDKFKDLMKCKRHRNAHRNAVGTGRVGSQGCPTLWTTKSRF